MNKNRQTFQQRGAVLVMALVMLTVLTIIGVSSLQSSSLELKIAANAQQHQKAFQAAQSMIALASADDPANTINYLPADLSLEQTITYTGTDGTTGSAKINIFDECIKAIGYELEGDSFVFNAFTIEATGQSDTGASTSVQVQAVRRFSAGC